MIIYGLIAAFSLGIDLLLFGSFGNTFMVNPPLFEMSFSRSMTLYRLAAKTLTPASLRSSNWLNVRFLENMWLFLPVLHLAFVGLIVLNGFFGNQKRSSRRNMLQTAFPIGAIILSLLSISVYNELRLQQREWQLLTRNPYRMESYLKRRACIDQIVNRYDPNYRTLYVSADHFQDGRGRNWKLIAETELHVQNKEKALFSYREFDHPYMGIMFGTFSGKYSRINNFPPLSSQVASNIDTIKLMGVKWIASADKKIKGKSLIYRGQCKSARGPWGELPALATEGGSIYLYEVANPFKIAFLVDSYKKVSLLDSLRVVFENKEHPWLKSLVYLEKDPILKNHLGSSRPIVTQSKSGSQDEATIISETGNTINIKVRASKEKFLVVSYLFRPNWQAYLDGVKVPLCRAYGGFMCVKIPAGKHNVYFKYYPHDVFIGFALTGLAF